MTFKHLLAMSPIRVCLIGLGAMSSPAFRSGEWGIQHLKSITSSPHYTLVGVCNSTRASSQKSIEAHELGPAVKAFGSAQEVASDPGVDLVVISVHISRHYDLIKPMLQHKKNVIVEFPRHLHLSKKRSWLS